VGFDRAAADVTVWMQEESHLFILLHSTDYNVTKSTSFLSMRTIGRIISLGIHSIEATGKHFLKVRSVRRDLIVKSHESHAGVAE
jgi:hypothetical protein